MYEKSAVGWPKVWLGMINMWQRSNRWLTCGLRYEPVGELILWLEALPTTMQLILGQW